MKKTGGIILLVLCGLFALVAMKQVAQELANPRAEPAEHVGYVVGSFLPTFLCGLFGLILVNGKKQPNDERRRRHEDDEHVDDYDRDAPRRSVRSDAIAAEPLGTLDDPDEERRTRRRDRFAERTVPSIISDEARANLFKNRSNICVALGLVCSFGGTLVAAQMPDIAIAARVVAFLGFPLMMWGCVDYARWKGRSGWWGLLGLASILGLVVLVLLPNRRQQLRRSAPPGALDALAAYDRIPGYRYLLTLLAPGVLAAVVIAAIVASRNVGAEEWKELSRPDLNFKVSMPGTPKFHGDTKKSPAGDIELHKFTLERPFGSDGFLIVVTKFPEAVAAVMGGQKKLLEIGRLDLVQAVKGQVKNERPIRVDDCEGLEFEVTSNSGQVVKGRVFATKNEIIEVAVFTSAARVDSADVLKFLDSFRLTDEPVPAPARIQR